MATSDTSEKAGWQPVAQDPNNISPSLSQFLQEFTADNPDPTAWIFDPEISVDDFAMQNQDDLADVKNYYDHGGAMPQASSGPELLQTESLTTVELARQVQDLQREYVIWSSSYCDAD